MHKNTYVKSSSGNIHVKFLNCSGGLAAVRIPFHVSPPRNSLMFTRNKDNIIFAYMKFWEARNADTFIFNPEKFQIITAARRHDRKNVGEAGDKKVIYATRIITEYLIHHSLSDHIKEVERIKERILYDNENVYDYVKVYFADDEIDDPRMNYFRNNRGAMFIPDIRNGALDTTDEKAEYYKNSILKKDADFMKDKNLVSEVLVPVMYNAQIPFGYLQVNRTKPFTNGILPVIKRTASLIEQLCNDYKIFTAMEEKFIISDVSTRGFGIVFNDRKYIPYFKEKSFVSLDIILPDNRKAAVLARVRHLEILEEKLIKAGLEIIEMDTMGLSSYEDFVRSVRNAA
jgi:hypothetical protein